MRVRIATAAREDLQDIWDYVSAESSDAVADRLIHRIRAAVGGLGGHPQAGSPRDDLAPGLRVVLEGPFLAFYVVEGRAVVVTRVIHGSRDLEALAQSGRLT